jgi:hypothetical protein
VVIDTFCLMSIESDGSQGWPSRDLPLSSVVWEGKLPPEDAPPWVCLAEPGAPVVVRRYLGSSRTCDVISEPGRWLLESCLVSRNEKELLSDFHIGGELALGDVQPGWCIVYAGHELWFPQRVLRVDHISETVQRVWTLGDASTRDVWGDLDSLRRWDNGIDNDWAYDEISWPHWEDGPWWPLQSEPLSENVRRFLLHKFDIAVECPNCGKFGQPIIYGMVLDPPPYAVMAGCGNGYESPEYGCKCGTKWSVTDQGRIENPRDFDFVFLGSGEMVKISSRKEQETDELNYDLNDEYPFGEAAWETLDEMASDLLLSAGISDFVEEWTDKDEALRLRYWGKDRCDIQDQLDSESTNTEQWLEPDE